MERYWLFLQQLSSLKNMVSGRFEVTVSSKCGSDKRQRTVRHAGRSSCSIAIAGDRSRLIYYLNSMPYVDFSILADSHRTTPHHSHSIVPGGLLVTSYTTRFTPFTSLVIRVATRPMNAMSNG